MSTENPLALITTVLGKFREPGSGKMFVFCEIACSAIIFSGAIGEKCKFLGVKLFLEIYFNDNTCIPVVLLLFLARH